MTNGEDTCGNKLRYSRWRVYGNMMRRTARLIFIMQYTYRYITSQFVPHIHDREGLITEMHDDLFTRRHRAVHRQAAYFEQDLYTAWQATRPGCPRVNKLSMPHFMVHDLTQSCIRRSLRLCTSRCPYRILHYGPVSNVEQQTQPNNSVPKF